LVRKSRVPDPATLSLMSSPAGKLPECPAAVPTPVGTELLVDGVDMYFDVLHSGESLFTNRAERN
jgi:hypothetical protein